MKKYNIENTTMNNEIAKYDTCSYFTKEAIKKAYHLITEFIYEDDPENTFGYTSLAVKIHNMKGIIPDDLHEKLLKFVTTEVKGWMLYPVPGLDEINDIESDEDLELAHAVLETPYNVLRKLHRLAEQEMEPYIGDKKYEVTEVITQEEEEAKKISDVMSQFKKIDIDDVYEERIKDFFYRCQIIIQLKRDKDSKEIIEAYSYGSDGGRRSWFGKTVEQELLYKNIIEHHFEVVYTKEKAKPVELAVANSKLTIEAEIPAIITDMAESGPKDDKCYYEFYVTKNYGDIENFGGKVEEDFISALVKSNK